MALVFLILFFFIIPLVFIVLVIISIIHQVIKRYGQKEQVQENDTSSEYTHDGMRYFIPTQEDIDRCNRCLEMYFENPESLLDTWLSDAMLYGPKLVAPTSEYLQTLSAMGMPPNYTKDLTEELLERVDLQIFNYKNKRFKFMRTNDRVSREFTKRIHATEVTIEDIDAMTGIEFEHFLCKLFTEDGFKAKVTQASNDQGGDLILEKGGGRIIVQAKNYSTHVSNDAVQQVIGAKAFYNCEYGMVITNNYFTKAAIQLAQCNEITIWSRDTLKLKLAEYNSRVKGTLQE